MPHGDVQSGDDQGLGNAVTLNSSPHGVSRMSSRTAAQKAYPGEGLPAIWFVSVK